MNALLIQNIDFTLQSKWQQKIHVWAGSQWRYWWRRLCNSNKHIHFKQKHMDHAGEYHKVIPHELYCRLHHMDCPNVTSHGLYCRSYHMDNTAVSWCYITWTVLRLYHMDNTVCRYLMNVHLCYMDTQTEGEGKGKDGGDWCTGWGVNKFSEKLLLGK